MRRALIAVLALPLFSFPLLPRQAPTTGSIEGIVVRSDSEQPIAKAQVTLIPGTAPLGARAGAPGQNPDAVVVSTGSDGKFSFKDVRPATYRLLVTANGFVRQEYGQRGLNGSGRLLFVAAGQSVTLASIKLTPVGT